MGSDILAHNLLHNTTAQNFWFSAKHQTIGEKIALQKEPVNPKELQYSVDIFSEEL